MNDHDIYLRQGAVNGGEWVGFALAWKGLAGVEGLPARPYSHHRPWILDPDRPGEPAAGHWGAWQWTIEIAMLDALVGLFYTPPEDGRTAEGMRADLLAFVDLPGFQLQDLDGTIHSALMTGYEERAVEQRDQFHPNGGWSARVELTEIQPA